MSCMANLKGTFEMKKALIALLFGLFTIPALADNTIVENLQELIETRDAITNAIVQKGGTVTSGALTNVPNEILSIPSGGGDNGKFISLVERTISGAITAQDLQGATTIGRDGFSRCPITSIELPSTVTSISQSAFFQSTTLTSITIPNSVTSIGDSAFYGCSGLTSIYIPYSVTNIATGAFQNSSNLYTVDFDSDREDIPVLGGRTAFSGLASGYRILVPGGMLASWKVANNWSSLASHICPNDSVMGGECVTEGNRASIVVGVAGTLDAQSILDFDEERRTLFSPDGTLWIADCVDSIDDSDFEESIGGPMYNNGGNNGCWGYLKFCNIPQEDVETWRGYPWGFPTNNISYLSRPE